AWPVAVAIVWPLASSSVTDRLVDPPKSSDAASGPSPVDSLKTFWRLLPEREPRNLELDTGSAVAVGTGEGDVVGWGVGAGVAVAEGVGSGVTTGVGAGVGEGDGGGVGLGVAVGTAVGVGAAVGAGAGVAPGASMNALVALGWWVQPTPITARPRETPARSQLVTPVRVAMIRWTSWA